MKLLILPLLLVAAAPFIVEWTVGQPERREALQKRIKATSDDIRQFELELGTVR